MRGSRIPVGKRVINSVPPLNPSDLSEANALNLMFLFDNEGTGDYLEDASIQGRHLRQIFAREQASPNMTLEVLPGLVWFSLNSYISFAGGNSPLFVAPGANPRIDVLTIRSDGNLYVIQGVEAGSPVPPTIPSTDIPIAQVYNVVGETTIHDNDSQVAGQGYIQFDLRPFIQVAVGSSAMPKIGLVARVSASAPNDGNYHTVLNFTGAGRLLGINLNGFAAATAIRVTIDGVAYTATVVNNGDNALIFATGGTTTMFAFSSGAAAYTEFSEGIFFKSSLLVEQNAQSAGVPTTTIAYEHE